MSLLGVLIVLSLYTTGSVLSYQQNASTTRHINGYSILMYGDLTEYVVTVDPDNDNATDNETCHPKPSGGGNSSIPCKSLDYVFQQFNDLDSIVFYLTSTNSVYSLHITAIFKNVNQISIIGASFSNETAVIWCYPPAGLSFLNSSEITLSNVRLVNCGALQESTSRDFKKPSMQMLMINVSLYFYNCINIKLDHIEVVNSSQAAGVVMYDTNGHVQVNSCLFYNNTAAKDGIPGGGAFTVEFTYCSPGDAHCSSNYTNYEPGYRKNNLLAEYMFTDCHFEHNVARSQNFTKKAGNRIFASLANHDGLGRGGGLSVFFKGIAVNKSVNITGCHFVNNGAVYGGGLLVEMDDNTISNNVFISRCNFTRNHAFFHNDSGTGGGGLFVSTSVFFWDDHYKKMNYTRNKIIVEHSNFTDNTAIEGGAVYFSIAKQTLSYLSQVTYLFVSDCSFTHNRAQLGAAVAVSTYPIFNKGFTPALTFSKCQYWYNHIANHLSEDSRGDPLKSHPSGMGIVYVNEVPITFRNITVFNSNNGTALSVVGAQVDFCGATAFFYKNYGTSGGAIALLGASSILIGPRTEIFFVKNSASIHGGAIYNRYISKEDLKYSDNCFIRYSDPFTAPFRWNDVKIVFDENRAERLGNSMYSTAVLPCSWGVPSTGSYDSMFCDEKTWVFVNSNCSNEIYTEPQIMRKRLNASAQIEVFPGRGFILPLDAFDDFKHNVTLDAVYAADIDSQQAKVEPSFNYVSDNYISITGKPGANVSLNMYTAGSRTTYIKLSLSILACPPGFVQSVPYIMVNTSDTNDLLTDLEFDHIPLTADYDDDNDLVGGGAFYENISCECPTGITFRGNLRCLYQQFHSQIHNRFWIGTRTSDDSDNNSTELLMGLVPQAYTTSALYGDEFIDIPQFLNSTDHKICGGGHRNGTLCGKCIDGYAVALNSPQFVCVRCNDTTTLTKVGNVFIFIALTYLPILCLFFAIIIFNFKLTSSAALSFVLFAQMMGSSVFCLTAGEASYVNNTNLIHMDKAYKAVYGLFNLNSLSFLIDPFCVSERLTTLRLLALEYIIASFPLVMIAMIHLGYRCKAFKYSCYRRHRRLRGLDPSSSSALTTTDGLQASESRAPKNTLIHAFVAFLFLSYTKFSLASMFTMSITELFNATGHSRGSDIVYFAGHLRFTDHDYLLPYGVIAILILIFVVILPPLLLLGPIQFIDWLIDKRGFRCLQRVWPSIKVHTFLDTFQGFYKPNRRFFSGVYFLFRLAVFMNYSFSRTLISQYVCQQIAVMILIVLVALFRPYRNEFYNTLDVLILFNLGTINAIAIYIFSNKSSSFPYGLYTIQYILVWLPLIYIICYAVWNRVHRRKFYLTFKQKFTRIFYPTRFLQECGTSEEQEQLLKHKSDTFGGRSLDESVNFSSNDPDERLFQRATKRNRFSHSRGAKISTTVVSIVGEADEDDVDGNLIKRDSGTSTGGSSRSAGFHSNDS